MQSKEEIEKALNNLWNSLDDELFNLTYSQEEMQEDLRIVLNEYNYLDVMNGRKQQKIKQLEDNYSKGYMARDTLAQQICKQCKYRKKARELEAREKKLI